MFLKLRLSQFAERAMPGNSCVGRRGDPRHVRASSSAGLPVRGASGAEVTIVALPDLAVLSDIVAVGILPRARPFPRFRGLYAWGELEIEVLVGTQTSRP